MRHRAVDVVDVRAYRSWVGSDGDSGDGDGDGDWPCDGRGHDKATAVVQWMGCLQASSG